MRRGLASLATISATASLLGLLGTVHRISNSFGPAIGSQSSLSARYGVIAKLSASLVTTILGLGVATFTLCAYRYLSNCVAQFQVDLESQSINLLDQLILHFRRSGNRQPLYFRQTTRSRSAFAEGAITDAPLLNFQRIYRHGLLELIWPRLQSSLDADAALHRGRWLAFLSAVLAVWFSFESSIATATAGVFLIWAGRGIQRGSFFSTAGLFVLLQVFATGRSITQLDVTASAFLSAILAFCFIGSLRAAWAVSYGSLSVSRLNRTEKSAKTS
jgi:hypothetical protein